MAISDIYSDGQMDGQADKFANRTKNYQLRQMLLLKNNKSVIYQWMDGQTYQPTDIPQSTLIPF